LSRPASLAAWLAYLETLHPKAIALGLERVRDVLGRLPAHIDCPVITVGGTNGKGSTCAMLESIYRSAGYATGLYASPHLLRYNERIRIRGAEAGDEALVQSFNAVEDARGDVPLTYFEFGTLAALWLFAPARLDVLVLEVGLGGRLDAVNAVAADVAVITSVDIDHVDYLGPTRDGIGREKAGIFRPSRPAICGDRDPPATVEATARDISVRLFSSWVGTTTSPTKRTQWRYRGPRGERYGLPVPALRGAYQLANASTALAAIDLLHDRLPVSAQGIREGLLAVVLPAASRCFPEGPRSCSTLRTTPTPRVRLPMRWPRWASIPRRSPYAQCSPTRTCAVSSMHCARASIAGSSQDCPARAAAVPPGYAMHCSRRAWTATQCAPTTTSRPRSAQRERTQARLIESSSSDPSSPWPPALDAAA
jgi:dihydrofolate synthase/folylpolyglutamate synthase